MKKKQRILQQKSAKLKPGPLQRKIKQTNYQPDSSREKKKRRIKSTILEMKMERSQYTTQKYKGS